MAGAGNPARGDRGRLSRWISARAQATPARRAPASAPVEKQRLQQIAAGRRLPVEHLAGDEHAGPPRSIKCSSTSSKATPPAVEIAVAIGAVAGEPHRHGLDQRGKRHRRQCAERPASRGLLQQADGDRRQARGLAQEGRQRLLAARLGEARRKVGERTCRAAGRCAASAAPSRVDRVAQGGRQRVDRAALDACRGDHRFAAHARSARRRARCASAAGPRSGARNISDQSTQKPQLAGASGATATPRSASSGTQSPVEPSRGQLAPPSARTVASAATTLSPVRRVEHAGARRRPSRASDGAVRNSTPRRARRRKPGAQQRRAFMASGNTRPLEPTKVGWPSSSHQARTAVRREGLDGRPQVLPRRAVAREKPRRDPRCA